MRDVLLATVGAYPAPSAEVPDYEDLFARVYDEKMIHRLNMLTPET